MTVKDNSTAAPLHLDQTALDKLQELIGGDSEMMAELCNSFLQEGPELIDQLDTASKTDDSSALRLAGHTLKSSMTDFGAPELAELCRKIEEHCVAGQPQACGKLVDRVVSGYPAFERALQQLVNQLDTP